MFSSEQQEYTIFTLLKYFQQRFVYFFVSTLFLFLSISVLYFFCKPILNIKGELLLEYSSLPIKQEISHQFSILSKKNYLLQKIEHSVDLNSPTYIKKIENLFKKQMIKIRADHTAGTANYLQYFHLKIEDCLRCNKLLLKNGNLLNGVKIEMLGENEDNIKTIFNSLYIYYLERSLFEITSRYNIELKQLSDLKPIQLRSIRLEHFEENDNSYIPYFLILIFSFSFSLVFIVFTKK